MDTTQQFLDAVEAGDVKAVSDAIEAGATIDYQDEDGYTPLMEAAWAGHLDVAKLLVENGADVNRWAQGDTPLMCAASSGHRSVFEYLSTVVSDDVRGRVDESILLDGEQRRRREDNKAVEALVDAAMGGRIDGVRDALADSVDADGLGSMGQTALHYAAFYGHISVVEMLLASGADVDKVNDDCGIARTVGTTALGLVASGFWAKNRCEVIRMLVEAGADVNVQDASGNTPLMNAVQAKLGFPDSVRALVEAKADLELSDRNGNTALMMALFGEKSEIVAILRDAGASDYGVNEVQLHKASYDGDLQRVRDTLVDHDVNVNHLYEWSALSGACYHGHTEIVQVLIDAGADVDLRDALGYNTPVMRAAYRGHIDATRLLIEAGADLTIVSDGLGTVLDYARTGKQERSHNRPWDELIAMLRKAGAKSSSGY